MCRQAQAMRSSHQGDAPAGAGGPPPVSRLEQDIQQALAGGAEDEDEDEDEEAEEADYYFSEDDASPAGKARPQAVH